MNIGHYEITKYRKATAKELFWMTFLTINLVYCLIAGIYVAGRYFRLWQ